MVSATIQHLLQPSDTTKSEERALVFLNTHFSSFAQLEREETLRQAVDNTRHEAERLCAELRSSQATLDRCIMDMLSSTRGYLSIAQELSLTRHALADELSSLASELLSSFSRDKQTKPTLLEELESLHRNLKELESVRSYVSIIERVLRLSEAAVAQARETEAKIFSSSCLTQYCQLQTFVSSVSSYCTEVENPSQRIYYPSASHAEAQPLNVVTFLFKIRDRTWVDIKCILSDKLLETAEIIGWPQPIEYMSVSAHDRSLFESQFLDLLRLQDAGDDIHASDPHWTRDGIYPIQTLILPIALRFKFHFRGKRDTNRLDKPEWYFTHVLNLTHTHRSFLETTIQGFLSKTSHKQINVFREFTLYLLPLIINKLQHVVPRLLHHPSLLAHTIYQALAFDATLREQGFSLNGTTAAKDIVGSKDLSGRDMVWEGVSEQILGKKEWFEAWLEGERKFADEQYNDIICSPDAWQVADDVDDKENSSAKMDLRPTNSARRVKALIEQVTDRYQPLPRFTARTRFLITIQIPILESYHSRISSSLDAFETLSLSFARAVPGALAGQVGHGTDARRLTSGVEGLGRLVKACMSAHYIALEMERWGEDLFFLELWTEINARAALRARAEAHPLLPDPSKGTGSSTLQAVEATSEGTIFQELVVQYRTLGERAENMAVRHICSEVESALKPYFLSLRDDFGNAPPNEISIPTTLVAPISHFSSHLVFLVQSLPSSLATLLYRRIASNLAAIILQRRVMQRSIGRLSLLEAKQIADECLLWVQACRLTVGRLVRRVEGPWARLLDAIKLVTLDHDKFLTVVDKIFDTDASGLEKLHRELEIANLDLGDLINVVRLREDCWR